MKKQVFSVLLTLCMASSTMPATVFGAEAGSVAVKAEVSQQDDSAKDAKEAGSSEAKVETPAGDTAKEDTAKEDTTKEDSVSGAEEDTPKEEKVTEEKSEEETPEDETKKEEAPESENTQKNETVQDADEQKQAEAAAQNADEKNAKDIAVQANEGEKDVESKTDLENALNDDNIHTINITGNIRYTDPLTTSKRIVVKNGSTFTWGAYQDTFNAPLEIESGAAFAVSAFDFMSKAIMSGSVTNNGTINVTGRGECFWNATVTGTGSFGATTEDTYIRYGTVSTDKLTGSYRINILDDQSVYPTVALPTTMYVGDTITPTFTNIIGGVDLASVFTFKWQDGNSKMEIPLKDMIKQ